MEKITGWSKILGVVVGDHLVTSRCDEMAIINVVLLPMLVIHWCNFFDTISDEKIPISD